MPLGMLLLLFANGSVKINSVPTPSVLIQLIFSPCAWMISLQWKVQVRCPSCLFRGRGLSCRNDPRSFDAVFWNADSGVFDGNKDFLIFFGRLDRDCGVCVAEFERIVDQVIKYLLDLAEISGDKQGFAA